MSDLRIVTKVIPVLLVAIIISSSTANATTLTQLTNNSYSDGRPRINDSGYVVWQGNEGNSDYEIFLYNGNDTIQLTANNYDDTFPQINSNGHIVWYGYEGNSDAEIFLYDGMSIIQVTNNDYYDLDPQINDNGYIAWRGIDGSDYEIFLYNGASTIQITNDDIDDWCPKINNNGYVVWQKGWGSDAEIYLYDGISTKNISNNAGRDRDPQINENGYIVWDGWDGSKQQIFLFDGTDKIQITNSTYGKSSPQINDNNHVVWMEHAEIFLFDGISTTQLTNRTCNDYDPQINNIGYVVWHGDDGSDDEIFLYDGISITQTINIYNDSNPMLNDAGYVVWVGSDGSDYEIFLASSLSPSPRICPNASSELEAGGGTSTVFNPEDVVYEVGICSCPPPMYVCEDELVLFSLVNTDVGKTLTLDSGAVFDEAVSLMTNGIKDCIFSRESHPFGGGGSVTTEPYMYWQGTCQNKNDLAGFAVASISLELTNFVVHPHGGGTYVQINSILTIDTGCAPPPAPVHPIANAGPDQTVEQESYDGTEVTLDGSGSTDPDSTPGTNDDIVSFDWYEGETLLGSGEIINHTFPLGEHIITLVVTDSYDDTDDDEVVVTVEDTTPPEVSMSVGKGSLWPPNHKMVLITSTMTVTDNCDADPEVGLQITMNEGEETNTYDPGYDATVGDGHTTDDIQVDENGNIYLRAERSGTGTGRIYTITYIATDASGNMSSATATVTVPHNQ